MEKRQEKSSKVNGEILIFKKDEFDFYVTICMICQKKNAKQIFVYSKLPKRFDTVKKR